MRLYTLALATGLATGVVAKPAGVSKSSYPAPQGSYTSTTGGGYATATSSSYPSASGRAPSESNSTANNQDLINNLELAATAVDRIGLLSDDHDFVYDFLNPPAGGAITQGKGKAIFSKSHI
jgi:hypothetical protein